MKQRFHKFDQTWRSRVAWSSAHDWKSCKPQKGFESSNLSFSATDLLKLCFKRFFFKINYLSYYNGTTAGLRVLLSAQKIMNKQGQMEVVNTAPAVMEIFEVTGFSDILTLR